MSIFRPFSAVRFLSICKSRYTVEERGERARKRGGALLLGKRAKRERKRERGDRNGSIDGRSTSLSPIVPSIGRRRRRKK